MDWEDDWTGEGGVCCNYCGAMYLQWGRNGLSPWMLMEEGKPHECNPKDWKLDDEIPF